MLNVCSYHTACNRYDKHNCLILAGYSLCTNAPMLIPGCKIIQKKQYCHDIKKAFKIFMIHYVLKNQNHHNQVWNKHYIVIRFCSFLQPNPPWTTLISSCCAFDQTFDTNFLQIRSRGRHPCLWLRTSHYRTSQEVSPVRLNTY